jgi:hypothetical protein
VTSSTAAIVDGEPEAALEPADSTEGQLGDTGVADDPTGHTRPCACAAMPSRERPPFATSNPGGIGLDTAHVRQVDDEAAV